MCPALRRLERRQKPPFLAARERTLHRTSLRAARRGAHREAPPDAVRTSVVRHWIFPALPPACIASTNPLEAIRTFRRPDERSAHRARSPSTVGASPRVGLRNRRGREVQTSPRRTRLSSRSFRRAYRVCLPRPHASLPKSVSAPPPAGGKAPVPTDAFPTACVGNRDRAAGSRRLFPPENPA